MRIAAVAALVVAVAALAVACATESLADVRAVIELADFH